MLFLVWGHGITRVAYGRGVGLDEPLMYSIVVASED